MNQHQLVNFFNNVMMNLGYHDWSIKFCNDNYCWIKSKTITIDLEYHGDIRQIILHEIAHIGTAKYCNQKHNPAFWKGLTYLTKKYLKRELDENQKNHMKFMTNGIYSLCYKN